MTKVKAICNFAGGTYITGDIFETDAVEAQRLVDVQAVVIIEETEITVVEQPIETQPVVEAAPVPVEEVPAPAVAPLGEQPVSSPEPVPITLETSPVEPQPGSIDETLSQIENDPQIQQI